MQIIAFRTPGLGDQSYLLVHDGRGVLVDPQRDVDRFLDAVAEHDVELRLVLETHLHNDYVSGAREAARRTGAELVLPAAAAPAYRHTPAFHTADIDGGGGLAVRPLHTPGHTPEHTSYVVLLDGEPAALFSGGSLLVGSAGRPDLLGPERAHTLGRLQYRSLHRLAALPCELGLYPTHGEGSFCTASGAGRLTSTIGDEADSNPLLALPDEDALAEAMLETPMPIPAFYRFMGPANTFGAPPMPEATVPDLSPEQLDEPPTGVHLVDIRPWTRQAGGLLAGSLAVELAEDFGSWVGWLVPREAPVVLVAEPGPAGDDAVRDAVVQLAQIGVDTVREVPPGPGFELADLPRFAALAREPGAQLLDVRMPNERIAAPWPGAVARFLPELLTEGSPRSSTGTARCWWPARVAGGPRSRPRCCWPGVPPGRARRRRRARAGPGDPGRGRLSARRRPNPNENTDRGCMTSGTETGAATVDVPTLRAELAANPDTLLVDVRTPGEFAAGAIPGAVNLPALRPRPQRAFVPADARLRLVAAGRPPLPPAVARTIPPGVLSTVFTERPGRGGDMCQRVQCPTCRKATYRGCGQHVEQVLAGVPADRRCTCAPAPHADRGLRRLFGR